MKKKKELDYAYPDSEVAKKKLWAYVCQLDKGELEGIARWALGLFTSGTQFMRIQGFETRDKGRKHTSYMIFAVAWEHNYVDERKHDSFLTPLTVLNAVQIRLETLHEKNGNAKRRDKADEAASDGVDAHAPAALPAAVHRSADV